MAAVAGVLLAATGCSSLQGSKAGNNFVTGDGTITQISPSDRGRSVSLDGKDLSGKQVSLDSMRGRPTVVNVWGAWCGPCQNEAPLLVSAAHTLGDQAHFLGIDSRD